MTVDTLDTLVICVQGGPWSQAEAVELTDQLLDEIGAHDDVDSVRIQLGNSHREGETS